MKQLFRIRTILLGIFLSFTVFFFVMPLIAPAQAAIVPCGRNQGTAAEMAPCTLCHLIVGIYNVVEWLRNVVVAFSLAAIAAMGVLYIVSTGNQSLMETAKGGMIAALIGFAVVISAWLMVNIIFSLPIFSSSGLIKTEWNKFTCDTTSAVRGVNQPGGPQQPGGGATCEDPTAAKARLAGGGTVCNNSGSCPSCNTAQFEPFIQSYGNAAGISLTLIRGLIARESSCNPNSVKSETNGTKSCGLMQVNTSSSSYTCDQLKDPETGIKEGVRILAAAWGSAQSLKTQYGSTVTVEELAAAIHNAGAGQSSASADCKTSEGWPVIPKWGCPINPGSAEFNACAIRNYACNVGACK